MTLTLDGISALAPDQASLKAAHSQMKARKWPLRAQNGTLVWGECQGSGANPYRTVFDAGDQGYKCTCPSRKFPCKHVLALMWMYVEDPAPFGEAPVADWVTDWLGRRRKTGGGGAAPKSAEPKSISAARLAEPEAKPDPKAEARRRAATEKRAQETEAALTAALQDLERWISDQLRTGLSGLIAELPSRCRAISARMVDGKAQALASRLDDLPGWVLARTTDLQADALMSELGKIVILIRAWRATPKDAELRRLVASAETRDSVMADPDAVRITSIWEVLSEHLTTRPFGISQETWLLNLGDGPRFAQLLDFFPLAQGKCAASFVPGDRFRAELAFYPARLPLRAVIAARDAADEELPWPTVSGADPLADCLDAQDRAPWQPSHLPLLLPRGRIRQNGAANWWTAEDGSFAMPVASVKKPALRAMELVTTAALWHGDRLTLLAAQTQDWGRVTFDG